MVDVQEQSAVFRKGNSAEADSEQCRVDFREDFRVQFHVATLPQRLQGHAGLHAPECPRACSADQLFVIVQPVC